MEQPTPQATPRITSRRLLIVLGIILLLFCLTYVIAWIDAYRLTQNYIDDADTSFNEGRYLDALLGYDEYSQEKEDYIEYGGYIQIRRIWSNRYAFPKPDEVQEAEQRIDEIIYERLTLETAEQFVTENIGRPNQPYLGVIYLRLGELYEEAGDLDTAAAIYEDVPYSFRNEADLIERARIRLENLQQKD